MKISPGPPPLPPGAPGCARAPQDSTLQSRTAPGPVEAPQRPNMWMRSVLRKKMVSAIFWGGGEGLGESWGPEVGAMGGGLSESKRKLQNASMTWHANSNDSSATGHGPCVLETRTRHEFKTWAFWRNQRPDSTQTTWQLLLLLTPLQTVYVCVGPMENPLFPKKIRSKGPTK